MEVVRDVVVKVFFDFYFFFHLSSHIVFLSFLGFPAIFSFGIIIGFFILCDFCEIWMNLFWIFVGFLFWIFVGFKNLIGLWWDFLVSVVCVGWVRLFMWVVCVELFFVFLLYLFVFLFDLFIFFFSFFLFFSFLE